MTRLFISNIPCDCADAELRRWIESQGFPVASVRVVRDLVAGVSPAFGYVSLHSGAASADAVRVLDGQDLHGRKLRVREDWRNERAG
jgi:RNA recognition motif-containing protein